MIRSLAGVIIPGRGSNARNTHSQCDSFLCGVIISGCGVNAKFSQLRYPDRIMETFSVIPSPKVGMLQYDIRV